MKSNLKTRLSLLILSFLFISFAQAQVKFGVRVGANISKQDFKQGSITVEPKSKFGLDLAVVSDLQLGEVISLGPELHWLQKGYKIEDIGGPIEELTATLNYLELPILVKFNFGELAKFFVMGGPSFGYLLDGKTEDENGNEDDLDLDDVNRIELGAHLGAGIGVGPLVFDIRYILGISNLAKDIPDTEIHNTGFGAGVSYMF